MPSLVSITDTTNAIQKSLGLKCEAKSEACVCCSYSYMWLIGMISGREVKTFDIHHLWRSRKLYNMNKYT